MRPEQVEELMRTMNEQQVVQVIPGEKAPDEPLESATVNRGATLWFVEGPM